MFERALLVLFAIGLAGCSQFEPVPGPEGTIHVLVVGGEVVESGPPPESHAVCDVAPPPFSADDDQRKIWWIDVEWYDWDFADAGFVVIRVDRTDQIADDGCWTYQMRLIEGDAGQITWRYHDLQRHVGVQSAGHAVRVGSATLAPDQETTWSVDASCWCDPYGRAGAYRYQGDLSIMYLGAWDRTDIILVDDWRDLPPLDVPYH